MLEENIQAIKTDQESEGAAVMKHDVIIITLNRHATSVFSFRTLKELCNYIFMNGGGERCWVSEDAASCRFSFSDEYS